MASTDDISSSSSSPGDGDGEFSVVRKGQRRRHRGLQHSDREGTDANKIVNLKEDEVPLEEISRVMDKACNSTELAQYRLH